MVWNFITEWENFNLQQLAVMAYNLGLAYFMWDIFKFLFGIVKHTFRRVRV